MGGTGFWNKSTFFRAKEKGSGIMFDHKIPDKNREIGNEEVLEASSCSILRSSSCPMAPGPGGDYVTRQHRGYCAPAASCPWP